ncbi:hypothetical protein [Burkholderia ubonensis]|uniref:hypothetical protein n=1 Tax=Burkholderia ubonensis TaxID=101571 RepID=UPI000319B529|nr:hypothetical protein [Burkholderia ubonensis]
MEKAARHRCHAALLDRRRATAMRAAAGVRLRYLGSAPVSVVSSDDTGASGLFAEPPP